MSIRNPRRARGVLWYSFWSFLVLAAAAGLQWVVADISGSRALRADTVHTLGDLSDFLVMGVVSLIASWRAWSEARCNRWAGRIIAAVMLLGAALLLWDALGPLLWLGRTWVDGIAALGGPAAGVLADWTLGYAHPVEPIREKGLVIGVAFLGAGANLLASRIRNRGARLTGSEALRVSDHHARADALVNLAVILVAVLPLGADPLVTLVVVAAIAWSAVHAWPHGHAHA
jgi:divalent metal cation (Fe/Co/Zn/Cd) transporter